MSSVDASLVELVDRRVWGPKFSPLYISCMGDLYVTDLRTMNTVNISKTYDSRIFQVAAYADQHMQPFVKWAEPKNKFIDVLDINMFARARQELIDIQHTTADQVITYPEFLGCLQDRFGAHVSHAACITLIASLVGKVSRAKQSLVMCLSGWLNLFLIKNHPKNIYGVPPGDSENMKKIFHSYYITRNLAGCADLSMFKIICGHLTADELFNIVIKHNVIDLDVYKYVIDQIDLRGDGEQKKKYFHQLHIENIYHPKRRACLPSRFECYICMQQNDETAILHNICACKMPVHYYCACQIIKIRGRNKPCPTCRSVIAVDWHGDTPYFSAYDIYPWQEDIVMLDSDLEYRAIRSGAVQALNRYFTNNPPTFDNLQKIINDLLYYDILEIRKDPELIRELFIGFSDLQIAERTGLYPGLYTITCLCYNNDSTVPRADQRAIIRRIYGELCRFGRTAAYFYHSKQHVAQV